MHTTSETWAINIYISSAIVLLAAILTAIFPELRKNLFSFVQPLFSIVVIYSIYKAIKMSKQEKLQKQNEEYSKLQFELFLKRKSAFEQHLESSDVNNQIIIKLRDVTLGTRQENIENVKLFSQLQLKESVDSDSFDIYSAHGVIGRTSFAEGKKINELGSVSVYCIERLESDNRLGLKIMVIKN